MRKFILTGIILLCVTLFSVKLFAPESNCLTILGTSPIRPYQRLIEAVVMVESGGDVMAYNRIENAVGAFQVRPIRLRDFNERTGKSFILSDMYDYDKALEVFIHYASEFHPSQSREIARAWNGSRTERYWEKVQRYL